MLEYSYLDVNVKGETKRKEIQLQEIKLRLALVFSLGQIFHQIGNNKIDKRIH